MSPCSKKLSDLKGKRFKKYVCSLCSAAGSWHVYITDGRMLTQQRRETVVPRRQIGQEELRAVIVVVVVADGKTGGPGSGGGGLCVSGLDALSLSLSLSGLLGAGRGSNGVLLGSWATGQAGRIE